MPLNRHTVETNVSETKFNFKDFVKVFSLVILLYAFFVGLFSLLPGVTGTIDGLHPTTSFLIQYVLQFVILFFPLWFFVVDKYGASLSDFGFNRVSWKKLIATVVISYLAYLVLSFIITTIITTNQLQVPGYEAQDSYIPLFGADWLGFAVAIIFIVGVAPFLEEMFFRGFIYRVFAKTWPAWMASVLAAGLFALVHFQINSILPLFLLGLILNYIYHRTGSVWTAVAFHAMNNAIAFGADVYLYFHPETLKDLEVITGFLYNL